MTKYYYGVTNIQTSGSNLSMLVDNVLALLSPLIFVLLLTLIKPELVPYDFVSMRAIELVDDDLPNPNQSTIEEIEHGIMHLTQKCRLIRIVAIGLTICLNIIWPWAMYGTSYIFSKSFFTGWIIFEIIWIIISFIIVGIYPIIENYGIIKSVLRLIYFDIKAF